MPLTLLAQQYDLVIVDGGADFPGQRICIEESGDDGGRDSGVGEWPGCG